MRVWLLVSAFVVACGSSGDDNSSTTDAGEDTGIGFDLDSGVSCPEGQATILTGQVVSPAKSNPDPIFNAVVYVPASELEPFKKGVSCAKCGTLEGVTKFKVAALTGADGKFKLEGVPNGKNIPIVVQIGRWRRKIVLPEVKACVTTNLPPDVTRLPRNRDEGDIPFTAIVSGRADPIECVLRKMGIDDSEFTSIGSDGLPRTPGRMNFFRSLNGPDMPDGTINGSSLYKRVDWMKQFDQILLPCEGDPTTTDKGATALANLVEYVNSGGRVLTSHFGFVWLRDSPDAGWKGLATWNATTDRKDNLASLIDMSFPKGKAMADWLQLVGATKEQGKLTLQQANIDMSGKPKAQVWINSITPETTQHFTFNTPLEKPPADQCGKVIYSDFHVVGNDDFSFIQFPNECTDGPLTAQERVMEFMLFDLASCVQPESEAPKPPR
jgi:hypothetical protein